MGRVEWIIRSIFLPSGKILRTRFEEDSLPVETWWEATLQVTPTAQSDWRYLISLKCVRPGGDAFTIYVWSLTINVSVNGVKKFNIEERSKIFAPETEMQVKGRMKPGLCHFDIEFDISAQEREYSYFSELVGLSDDLERLRNYPWQYDMRVQSNLSKSIHYVHSSIIRARWNNFFREHPKDANDPKAIVKMDISNDLLSDILDYMYTGSGRIGERESISFIDITELIRVIERYGLGHLKKVFYAFPESKVIRVLTNSFSMEKTFPVTGPPFEAHRETWHQSPFPDVQINFDFEFGLHRRSSYFSYTLQFVSPSQPRALVIIECETQGGDDPPKILHVREQLVSRHEDLDMWTSHYSGYLEDLWEFMASTSRLRSVRGSIRFIFHMSNGEFSEDIAIEGSKDASSQKQRLADLSDHMFRLFEQRATHGDLSIAVQGDPWREMCHKEIFTVRVRRWRKIIREDLGPYDPIPREVTCDVKGTTFKHVLDFIYTSRVFDLSASEVKEMLHFVREGNLGYAEVKGMLGYMYRIDTTDERLSDDSDTEEGLVQA